VTDELELVARLRALATGRAQRIASHRQVAVRPDALVLACLAMAGEDTSIHAVACGRVGAPPEVWCVPDPRFRDDQYRLFAALGARIERYYQECRDDGAYPQLWVASGAGVAHLDVLADRLRFNRLDARVKRFGELLAYAAERAPVEGQQALLTATGALSRHWATGQQPGEDEHLGALLTWIAPPAGLAGNAQGSQEGSRRDILDAVAAAERVPMGVKTDPAFDRQTLEPLVTAYNAARRREEPPAALARRARAIRETLEPEVRRVYDATQRAIALLLGMGLPPLPDLAAMEDREAAAFASFMASRDGGYGLPLRDQPRPAVFKLTEREDARENAGAAVTLGDRVARARGRLTGRVLRGAVADVREVRAGPRRVEHRLVLVSDQRVLHVRRRDDLRWVDDPRLRFTVLDVRRTGRSTRLTLAVAAGMRAVGVPRAGATLELAPGAPEWWRLYRTRKHLSERLRVTPWTHADGPVPPPTTSAAAPPADPLALVEALR
jgi:hypothetical protein